METNVAKTIIKCPHCGYEYTLEELFVKEDIFGWPQDIIRDPLGKILYVGYKDNEEPEYKTKYICDHCDKPFIAELKISVNTYKEDEELDFSNTTVSLF